MYFWTLQYRCSYVFIWSMIYIYCCDYSSQGEYYYIALHTSHKTDILILSLSVCLHMYIRTTLYLCKSINHLPVKLLLSADLDALTHHLFEVSSL